MGFTTLEEKGATFESLKRPPSLRTATPPRIQIPDFASKKLQNFLEKFTTEHF
jgi:hypothetical protein